MENIYDPKCFRSSEPFNTKEYFLKYEEVCPVYRKSNDEEKANKFNIMEDMGVSEDLVDFETLEESCSTDLLQLLDEPHAAIKEIPEVISARTRFDVSYPVTETARRLNVVRCKEIVEKRTNMQVICNKRFLKAAVVPKNSHSSNLIDILPGTNFVYSIYVYKPFSILYGQKNSAEKMRFAMEIEALGTNTLAEFADTIQCISNMGLFREVENTKIDLDNLCNAKKHYPSQTIFIDGVFYNDFRSKQAIDYSKCIIEWAQNNGIGKFTSAEMSEVTLDSLTPRFGFPYVYIHHGNCEHIFAFSDARLIQSCDSLNSKQYPRIYSITRSFKQVCFLCNQSHSTWVVRGCDRFPHEKVFLCTECCDSYLYKDGEKIGDFKLYPYYDIIST